MALHYCLLRPGAASLKICEGCAEAIRFGALLASRLADRLEEDQVQMLTQVAAVDGCDLLPGMIETYLGREPGDAFEELLDALAATPADSDQADSDAVVLAEIFGDVPMIGNEWQQTAALAASAQ